MGWQNTLAQLDAALQTASPMLAESGRQIRDRLIYVGRIVDGVESADHGAWRASVAAFLSEANRVARIVDGGAPPNIEAITSIDPEAPLTARGPIMNRLARALSLPLTPETRSLVASVYMQVQSFSPSEPARFGQGTLYPLLDALLSRTRAKLQIAAGGLAAVSQGAVFAQALTDFEAEALEWLAFAASA